MNELDWKQPALIGGLLAGVLSVIPGINLLNACCCAWLLIGGAVAAKTLINRTPRPVKAGEGAQVGAIAGLIASGIYLIIGLPIIISGVGDRLSRNLLERFAEISNNPELQELARKVVEQAANQTTGQRLVSALPGMVIGLVLFLVFSTLGGLLGVALFEKRRDQPPPPQYPPQYPSQYPQQSAQSPQSPQSAPPADYPPQNPPQSGGWGGDQGGQGS
ncbi:MAG TPA: hypothetical protein VFS27_05715 [Blastocatellia bacterium]|nr:hypothetical protein [Blastocatellia bacterium]